MKIVIDRLYQLTDKSPLRALSLILALVLAGCVLWQPARFNVIAGPANGWFAILIVWSVCAGVIHGSGFRPRTAIWRLLFLPSLALLVMAAALIHAFR
ncbi:cyd operon protein YbgE [Martelella alba]|uniref:Cyd operon protein YbgE n=1 Tax=Martelella alba TaxID=2590451 RepID=A0ABY2SL40_9HYPH|nr:cyd operon protein YbgE [Martelella alba]